MHDDRARTEHRVTRALEARLAPPGLGRAPGL